VSRSRRKKEGRREEAVEKGVKEDLEKQSRKL
jgi:hypothetical protein